MIRIISGALSVCIISTSFLSVNSYGETVTIDPSVKYQQFEGWGTSLCWWAVLAGKWSETNRNKLIDAIVAPDTGLGYNCFRYNIGGGDQPSHSHLSEARAVPGFKKTETSQYDWTADQNQRNILLGIAAKVKEPVFEAFSNSPPWWMTISGCASGNTNGADNLKPAYFTAFAEYLADVVKHYKDNWGITFRVVEPFNEPSSGYWKINGGQEGCGFKSNQSKMINELGKQLVAKGLFTDTKVSAADETSLEHTVASVKSYSDSAFMYLSQINSHSYGGWKFRHAVDSLAKLHKKVLWQSESGPLGKADTDKSDITMWMSDVIIQDLRVMKPNAWIDWQVCDPVANWMTIELNHTNQSFKYTKRYYMHAAFSRFIRPGSQFISSSDTNSVAAIQANTGNLVVVIRNSASASKQYTIDLSKFDNLPASAQIHRFTLPGSLNKEADAAIANKQFSFTAPQLSITTCVIPVNPTHIDKGDFRSSTVCERPQLSVVNSRLKLNLVSVSPFTLSIFNGSGKKMADINQTPTSHEFTVDLDSYHLAKGMYAAEVRQNGKLMFRNVFTYQ